MTNQLEYICDNKRHLICRPYSVANLHVMAISSSSKTNYMAANKTLITKQKLLKQGWTWRSGNSGRYATAKKGGVGSLTKFDYGFDFDMEDSPLMEACKIIILKAHRIKTMTQLAHIEAFINELKTKPC